MEAIILKISILAIPVLLAITLHEYAHGWMASRLGDPTARLLGRLSLNPLKHLDPVGTLAFFITGMIGWAKPVPVNAMRFKDPKKGMMWVAMAGPAANLAIAVASAMVLRLMSGNGTFYGAAFPALTKPIYLMLHASVFINIGLAVFNFIPIPPLDGGRVLAGLLPYRQALAFSRIEPYGFLILIVLMFSGLVHTIISPIVSTAVWILFGSGI